MSSAGGGVFGYNGQPSSSNLSFSLAADPGTDNFGNEYPAGLGVSGGNITGTTMTGITMDSTSSILGSLIQAASVLSPSISGGTAASLVHTMINSSGAVLGYTQGASASTYSTNGTYQFTVPTGVTSLNVKCWGAGAGGGGGSASQGGESGGGGEFAEEPSYAVNPGDICTVIVGKGGQGGATGNPGANGSVTQFNDPTNGVSITANPGIAGVNFLGGAGGSGSMNTVHYPGGNGNSASGNTGGAGAGSSAGSTGEGNQGNESTSSTGAAGATAPSGGGNGGAGGNIGLNGGAGSSPGGGGGGAGASSASMLSNVYTPSNGTYSYYGAASSNNPNKLRNHDGYLWQGGNVNTEGRQYSYITLPWQQIQSDLTNATVHSVAIYLRNLWCNNTGGMSLIFGYSSDDTFGNTGDAGVNTTQVLDWYFQRGQTQSYNVGLAGGIGVALQNGACKSLAIGPYNGSNSIDLYYGYFDSGANGGVTPEMTVYYYIGGTAPANAGNGADGQVVVTYGNSTSPALISSISSVSGSDTFGNPYSTGVSSTAFNFTGTQVPSSTSPTASTVASSGVVTANTSGTMVATNTSGFAGMVATNLADVTLYSTTAATNTQITNQYTVPANDANVGTTYRLTAWGDMHIAALGSEQAAHWWVTAFGNTLTTVSIASATEFTTGTFYSWHLTSTVQVTSTGSGGAANAWMSGVYGAFNTPQQEGNAGALANGTSGNAAATNAASTIYLQAAWSATETSQTMRCFGSTLERLGP